MLLTYLRHSIRAAVTDLGLFAHCTTLHQLPWFCWLWFVFQAQQLPRDDGNSEHFCKCLVHVTYLTYSWIVDTPVVKNCPCLPHEGLQEGAEVQFHSFLRLTRQAHCQVHAHPHHALPPGETPESIHWLRGWVGPEVGMGVLDKRKTSASAGNWTPVRPEPTW